MIQITSEINPIARMDFLITTVFSPLPETPSPPVWPLPITLCLSTHPLSTRSCWFHPRKFNHIHFPATLLSSSHVTSSEISYLHRGWSCFQSTTNATSTQQQNKTIPTIPPPQINQQNPPVRAYSISKRGEKSFQIPEQNFSASFQSKHQCFPQKNLEGNQQLQI